MAHSCTDRSFFEERRLLIRNLGTKKTVKPFPIAAPHNFVEDKKVATLERKAFTEKDENRTTGLAQEQVNWQ